MASNFLAAANVVLEDSETNDREPDEERIEKNHICSKTAALIQVRRGIGCAANLLFQRLTRALQIGR